MNQELLTSLEYVEKEKGVSKEVLLEALRQALLTACKKTYGEESQFDIEINPTTCEIRLLENGKPRLDRAFGRIAAQTAKQVIIQKLREAERESVFDQFKKKEGDIITGTVHRIESKAIIVDLGKAEGILPAREQCPQEQFRQGNLVRAYVVEVKKTSKGPEIILSRSHPGLVQRLFELEVPEIHDGIVQIKGGAREAGSRTKIAVHSKDDKIDSVGSCVGIRGQRVKNIVRELGGEKIDIIRYSDDTRTYIKNAMAPAELKEIHLDAALKKAEIVVEDDQLSLAIGKRGQNVRLASKLLGWHLDVRSASQKIPLKQVEGISAETVKVLNQAEIHTIKDLLSIPAEELSKIPGANETLIKEAISAVQALQRKIQENLEAQAAAKKEDADHESA